MIIFSCRSVQEGQFCGIMKIKKQDNKKTWSREQVIDRITFRYEADIGVIRHFKISMTNMLNDPVGKVENIYEQMWKLSRKNRNIENQMKGLEIKTSNTVLEMSNSFNWLISKLNTAEQQSIATKSKQDFTYKSIG